MPVMRLFLAAVVLASTSSAAASPTDRIETFYSVSAHSDDEIAGWGMIQHRPLTYVVFILLTRGEQTTSCMTPEESVAPSGVGLDDAVLVEGFQPTDPFNPGDHPGGDRYHGPYKYQGPDSPVGQPDKRERHPFGSPWQGQGSQACKDARVASWLWFLDDVAELDDGLPDLGIGDTPFADDTYRGAFCFDVGCADVWSSGEGARVAFDLGDRDLTADEVAAATMALHNNRAAWGIPILPQAGVLANTPYPYVDDPLCQFRDDHPDHVAVHDAVFSADLGAGPQFGVACAQGERFRRNPGPVMPIDPRTLIAVNYVDPVTEQRIGPYQVNYGWLLETYSFVGVLDPTYWKRFG